MKAVLLVGGAGTRLRPLTHDVPKPLLPIAEVPYLEQLVHYLAKFDVDEMILTSCHLSEQIEAFCGRTQGLEFKLTYVFEETPLGTGGAVGNVGNLLDETFIVLNGDILSNFDLTRLVRFHHKKKGALTIALIAVEDPSRYGVAELTKESRIERFIEKPKKEEAPSRYINAGMYVVEPEVLKSIPKGKNISIEREIFPRLAEWGTLFGCVLDDYWLDMGTPSEYLQSHYDFLRGKIALKSRTSWNGQNWLGRNVTINPGAKIVSPVLLGDGCVVESDAIIGPDTVLGKGCVVEAGAIVEGSVFWESSRIGRKARVKRTIAGAGAQIKEKAEIQDQVIRSEGKWRQ